MGKNKIIIIFIVIVIGLFVAWILFLNPKTSVVESQSACYNLCTNSGFYKGMCMRSGSGVGSRCQDSGGVQLHSIIDRNTDIPGCNLNGIGVWDECCCF